MAKASTSAEFRALAIKDPIAVLNETGGLKLPSDTPIRFVDKQEEILVPLPPFGSDQDEITDEEMLASVSGGTSPVCAIGAYAVVTFMVAVIAQNIFDKK